MLEKMNEVLEQVKRAKFPLKLDLQLFAGNDPQDPPTDPVDPPADPQDPPVDPPVDPVDPNKGKTFTQEDVNAIAAKEAKKAQEKILKLLGVKDFETAKDGLAKFKDIQDSQKSEADKLKDTLKAIKDQNADYQQQVSTMSAQLAAVKAGVVTDSLDDVIVLAKNLVTEDVTVDDAIQSVLTKYPHFKVTQEIPDKKQKPKFSDGEHKKDDKQSEQDKWLQAFKF